MKVSGDFSGATRFNHMMMNLEKAFKTDRHLTAASDAAFSILQQSFGVDTDLLGAGHDEDGRPTGQLAHVYEYGMEGTPPGRLWDVWMEGTGSKRLITWDWLPSKTIVPIYKEDYPEQVPVEKLKERHIFIWKAPILEYGTEVTVRRRWAKALLIPYPDRYPSLARRKKITDGDRTAAITKKEYSFVPGEVENSIGRFTGWFVTWWGERAEDILSDMFEPARDNRFKAAFLERTRSARRTANSRKKLSWTYDTQAAADGAKDAIEISREVEKEYLRIARMRR